MTWWYLMISGLLTALGLVEKNVVWEYCDTFVPDETPAKRRDDPLTSDLMVLEQNGMGKYRVRSMSEVIDSTETNED